MIDYHRQHSNAPRVLLTSVFGPYAQDDEYGSRKINPMELYHNQVTRTQGPFSLRMFHRSWGLMLIQSNIDAPCTLLDFPTLDRFIEELRTKQYDVIGISSIIPNTKKVEKMCRLIRRYQPDAEIVVGGHVANVPDIGERLDADHIVKGDGVRWFREYLGEDPERPINHPTITTRFGTRTVGINVDEGPEGTAATVIPSVGCPMGCNFCSTSAMFGGKGKFVNFYETGDELFDIMCKLEAKMRASSFFMMDENFLLYRDRALRLMELMEEHDKAWTLYVFSSAKVVESYRMEELVRLGVSWIWMGLEGENSQYGKLNGVDTFELVKRLQSHGIRILGSTIIGLENHTPKNIDAAIDYAVRHNTDFHQFMLYTPLPGTPFYREMEAAGRLKDAGSYDVADIHGQDIFNYKHANIPQGMETELVLRAFDRDFEVNGPSMVRIVDTVLQGWRRYRNHPNPAIRRRFGFDSQGLATTYSALVGASILYYKGNPRLHAKMKALGAELAAEFGWKSRFYQLVGGRYLLRKIRKEEKRLDAGWAYEPPTFYDTEPSFVSPDPALREQALARPSAPAPRGLPVVETAGSRSLLR